MEFQRGFSKNRRELNFNQIYLEIKKKKKKKRHRGSSLLWYKLRMTFPQGQKIHSHLRFS